MLVFVVRPGFRSKSQPPNNLFVMRKASAIRFFGVYVSWLAGWIALGSTNECLFQKISNSFAWNTADEFLGWWNFYLVSRQLLVVVFFPLNWDLRALKMIHGRIFELFIIYQVGYFLLVIFTFISRVNCKCTCFFLLRFRWCTFS